MFANFYTFCKFHIQILSSVQSLCHLFYSLDFEWRLIDQLLQLPQMPKQGQGLIFTLWITDCLNLPSLLGGVE